MAQQVTLEASSVKTATGNSAETFLNGAPNIMTFELDLTAAALVVGDTLDVFIQTKVLSNFVDVVHFTQILGDGGVKRYYTKTTAALALTEFENGAALGAAAVREILGVQYRVRWVIAGPTPSFTFSVAALSDVE